MRRPLEIRSTLHQLESLGVKSMGIVAVTSLFIGMVMTIQFAFGLRRFGGVEYIPRVIVLSFCRELAPTLTAVIVGGRIGSGMAAEVGAMNVTEQVDAIRALGADPAKKLVLPRVLAAVIVMPLLSVYALALGDARRDLHLRGAVRHHAEPSSSAPRSRPCASATSSPASRRRPSSASSSRSSAATSGCSTTGGTEGVGLSTTRTVVAVSIAILIADFFLTKLLMLFQAGMKHARVRQIAIALVVSPALVIAGLALDAQRAPRGEGQGCRRDRRAREAPAHERSRALRRRTMAARDLARGAGRGVRGRPGVSRSRSGRRGDGAARRAVVRVGTRPSR